MGCTRGFFREINLKMLTDDAVPCRLRYTDGYMRSTKMTSCRRPFQEMSSHGWKGASG